MDMDMLRKRLVYQIPGMEATTVRRDVPYLKDGDATLHMDVYSPPGLPDDARLPAMILVHGGPFRADLPLQPKDWGIYQSYGELMAASGLVGVTFNHRLYGFDQQVQAAGDIAAAIDYVRTHADELHIDADRLGLWTFSGSGTQLSGPLRERPAFIRCLVAFYPILELGAFVQHGLAVVDEEDVRQFSPALAIHDDGAACAPLLIARAGQDHPALSQGLDAFVQAALAANIPLDLMNHPRGQHGFDILDDDERSREIIAHAIAFVQTHLQYLTSAPANATIGHERAGD
jgi:acetyl esterase/lipase